MTTSVMNFPGNRVRALTLSYDDGVEQDIRLCEILNTHGIKCTFNINTGVFAPEGTVYEPGTIHRRMTQKQAVELYANSGHEVAVHTLTHPHLEYMTPQTIVSQVMGDRANIENLFGTVARGMAYPYGTFNGTVVEALRSCGICYSRTVNATNNFGLPENWLLLNPTCHHKSEKFGDLTSYFLRAKTSDPLLFYLWGHSYEFEEDDNWELIEEFAEKVGGHDRIWYATNIEVYDYVQAWYSLAWSTDSSTVYNPSSQDVYFTANNRPFCVKSGETLKLEF